MFKEPISQVVQDIREQRMSLCQSLRQYVFVHAAIIEGALLIADEEREHVASGQNAGNEVLLPTDADLEFAGSLSHSITGGEESGIKRRFTQPRSSSRGKRVASPTEPQNKDKSSVYPLSKSSGIKRPRRSTGGLRTLAESNSVNDHMHLM
jgi:tyrosine-protein phosphatase 2/3